MSKPDPETIAKTLAGLVSKKFTIGDVPRVVVAAMEAVEAFSDLDGAEKEKFVVDIVKRTYELVDPDIPYVPAFLESWIERAILDALVPAIVHWVCKAAKGKVAVNDGGA